MALKLSNHRTAYEHLLKRISQQIPEEANARCLVQLNYKDYIRTCRAQTRMTGVPHPLPGVNRPCPADIIVPERLRITMMTYPLWTPLETTTVITPLDVNSAFFCSRPKLRIETFEVTTWEIRLRRKVLRH
jgi:hypothetical protein